MLLYKLFVCFTSHPFSKNIWKTKAPYYSIKLPLHHVIAFTFRQCSRWLISLRSLDFNMWLTIMYFTIFSFNFLLPSLQTFFLLSSQSFALIYSTFNIIDYNFRSKVFMPDVLLESAGCDLYIVWERVSIWLAFLIHTDSLFWKWQRRNNFWVDLFKDRIANGKTEKQAEALVERQSEEMLNKVRVLQPRQKWVQRRTFKVGTEVQHPWTPKLWGIWVSFIHRFS